MSADFQHRPPDEELKKIIEKAKSLITGGRIAIPDDLSQAGDADELGHSINELIEILLELLDALAPKDFVGKHPLRRRDDPKIQCLEIYEFKKDYASFNCKINLKFSIDYEKFRLILFSKRKKN